jgi:hypothetical protein
MRVLVCGSRTITDKKFITSTLKQVFVELIKANPDETYTVITGGAAGPDKIANDWAERQWERSVFIKSIEVYPAQWDKYGKSAGYKRNRQMIDSGVDLVIAFWDGGSKGTEHTMDLAKRCGIKVQSYFR